MIPSFEDATFRLLSALALGAIVGVEREWTQKSAGLRTHILVCLGSAIFTLISVSDWTQQSGMDPLTVGSVVNGAVVAGWPTGLTALAQQPLIIRQDPTRIMAQIVTGIGFIGGGALLHYGTNVRGVTTAASLWLMAGIGMLAGVGQQKLAAVAALLGFLVLFTLGRVEHVVFKKHKKHYEHLSLTLLLDPEKQEAVEAFLHKAIKPKRLLSQVQSTHQGSSFTHLAYTADIRGLHMDWHAWRKKLDEQAGVASTGLKLATSLPAPKA
jgi:putative Mg2+ transporter-C (MgtC) family protein